MWDQYVIQVQGGLVKTVPEIQQGIQLPGTAGTLVNFEVSLDGGYRRINGYAKWDDAPVPYTTSQNSQIQGVGFLNGEVVVARETQLHKSSGSGWTTIVTTDAFTDKCRFTKINLNGTEKLIGCCSSRYPFSYDGTAFTNITGTTDVNGATLAIQFKDYVFYAKGSLLVYSIPFDETDFTVGSGSGSINIKGDITGLAVFRSQLFIFTENNIQVLSGSSTSDFRLESVSETVGCIDPDSVKEVSGDIMFLSSDGIRRLGATEKIGDFSNQIASSNIRDAVKSFISLSGVTSYYIGTVIREKSQYRLFRYRDSSNAESSEGFVATQIGEDFYWSKLRGFKVFSAWSEVYNNEEYVIFSSDTEYIYRMDIGSSFDGQPILASYFTPYLSLDNNLKTRKSIYKITTYLTTSSSVNGTVSLVFDRNSLDKIQPDALEFSVAGVGAIYGGATYGQDIYGNSSNVSLSNITSGAGFNVALQYSFTEDQEPFTIDTIVIDYKQEGKY